MSALIQARLVRIGNSQGLRLPKAVIEQANLGEEIEVEASHHEIVLRPSRRARAGWGEQFQAMSQNGDDTLLDAPAVTTSQWDNDEWNW